MVNYSKFTYYFFFENGIHYMYVERKHMKLYHLFLGESLNKNKM